MKYVQSLVVISLEAPETSRSYTCIYSTQLEIYTLTIQYMQMLLEKSIKYGDC